MRIPVLSPRGARRCAGMLAAVLGAARAGAQVPGELRGRVVDSRTSAPLAGARVSVRGRAESIRTGVDGTFALRGLEPRPYVVRVRAVGFLPREIETSITNGRATVLDVALDPSPATLDVVRVTAARDTQASTALSFDRAAIERSGQRELAGLLQSAPSVVITRAGGPGAESHASIRGSSANEVLVLVDGMPVNSAITGVADLSRVTLEGVERVTVRTGAQSARYGGRALAGVIEIQTRRATRALSALVRSGSWGEREVSASLGSARRAGTARLNGSLTGDYRTVRGDFPYERPAVRGGGSAERLNAGVTSTQLAADVSLEGARAVLRARASLEDLRRGLAGSVVQPSVTGREAHSRLGGGLDARGAARWLAWSAAATLTRERSTSSDPAPPFGVPFDDTLTATGATASATMSATGAWGTIATGADLETLDVASTMLAPGAPRWQRTVGGWGSARASHAFDDARVRIDGDLSVRVDQSSLIEGSMVSPRAALSLSAGAVTASASVGSGYAPPGLADLFFHEGVRIRANPALRPERVTADVEARLAARDLRAGPMVLSGSGALFRANVDGMILWLPDFQYVWSPSNVAVRRSGWEVTGRASLPAAGADIQGTLNRANVVYAGPVLGGQVTYRPRTTATVTTGLDTRRGRFELSPRYVGERRTVPGSGLNTLDPYWLLDARWIWSLTEGRWQFDVAAGVDNLLDRPAAMLVDYPFPGRAWSLSLRVRRSPFI